METHIIAGGICAFVLALCSCGRAEELAPPRSPVTAQQALQAVADELRARGFPPEQLPQAADLELPSAVPVRTGEKLRVSSVCWDADAGRARFRLECPVAGACLPFLVYVRAASHALAASCRMEAQLHASAPKPEPAVRAGERATAVLVAAGLRMTSAVTCLERGAAGDIIRVRGHEGRVFRARVAGPALVEALGQ